jgi:DNA-directed RNA polymerase subunit beta
MQESGGRRQGAGDRVGRSRSRQGLGKVSAYDVVDMDDREVLLECNEELTEESIASLLAAGIEQVEVLFIDNLNVGLVPPRHLLIDKIESTDEAVIEIYRRLRPGDPPTLRHGAQHFENLFFNPERYDLSRVGRTS